ncbi:zinc finger protein 33B [Lingula anatina]|uniref:Zinc finger protein 33B n=1 Tax=Lingula anatina TaxID=7574 RepID=A0A1S3H876_LINAN|nr:zinc finger protein 33B [Lingula anatina]XP_013382321.1 zinc finger protein 33B [Lingula anatina]XP_013382322.1 zinc finger protein 33B [Lingula anatina]|eukprot:XP_013382320.1 zinc finger protein 33B [Lingula anatina]
MTMAMKTFYFSPEMLLAAKHRMLQAAHAGVDMPAMPPFPVLPPAMTTHYFFNPLDHFLHAARSQHDRFMFRDQQPNLLSAPLPWEEIRSPLLDKKMFRCHQCHYITDRKNNLKRHIITMHQSCTKLLECCDIIFPNKAMLRHHVVTCHRDGYNCRICGRSFCRKALLKRHVSVHSGRKDFVCSVCGYATSHKSNLERHKKRHSETPSEQSSPIIQKQSSTESDIDVGSNDHMDIVTSSDMHDEPYDMEHEEEGQSSNGRLSHSMSGGSALSSEAFSSDDSDTDYIDVCDDDDFPVRRTKQGDYPHKKYRYKKSLFTDRITCTHSAENKKCGNGESCCRDDVTPDYSRIGVLIKEELSDPDVKEAMPNGQSAEKVKATKAGEVALINTKTEQEEAPMDVKETGTAVATTNSLTAPGGSPRRLFSTPYKCQSCQRVFQSQVELSVHWKRCQIALGSEPLQRSLASMAAN